MIVQYDRAAIQALMENLEGFRVSADRKEQELSGEFRAIRQKYTRLRDQLEELVRQARRAIADAQADYRAARRLYDAAMETAANAEEESDRQSAQKQADDALERMSQAQVREARAEADLQKQENKLQRLDAAWNAHGPAVEGHIRDLQQEQASSSALTRTANRDLEQFLAYMEQARAALQGTSPSPGNPSAAAAGVAAAAVGVAAAGAGSRKGGTASHATSPGAQPASSLPGWCPKNSMQSIHAGSAGGKTLSLTIGDRTGTYSCDKNGLAEAYDAACSAGDSDMVARLSAMFEIETLREDLELEAGDPAFAQLGGYHRDVSAQDPAGYESHHIPARSVLKENAGWLPAISITEADHALTSSYRGRQNHSYTSLFSPSEPALRYKDQVSQKIAQGGSGYVEALRNEIWDLRLTTGHRYDGGISACLDAVIDLLATRGIPGSK